MYSLQTCREGCRIIRHDEIPGPQKVDERAPRNVLKLAALTSAKSASVAVAADLVMLANASDTLNSAPTVE